MVDSKGLDQFLSTRGRLLKRLKIVIGIWDMNSHDEHPSPWQQDALQLSAALNDMKLKCPILESVKVVICCWNTRGLLKESERPSKWLCDYAWSDGPDCQLHWEPNPRDEKEFCEYRTKFECLAGALLDLELSGLLKGVILRSYLSQSVIWRKYYHRPPSFHPLYRNSPCTRNRDPTESYERRPDIHEGPQELEMEASPDSTVLPEECMDLANCFYDGKINHQTALPWTPTYSYEAFCITEWVRTAIRAHREKLQPQDLRKEKPVNLHYPGCVAAAHHAFFETAMWMLEACE